MREAIFGTLEDEPSERFAVVVAVLAVVTTLVAAVVGILFATSSNESERLNSLALRHAIAASQASDSTGLAVGEQLRLLEQRRTQVAAARFADERRTLEGDDAVGSLATEVAGWRALVAATDRELERNRAARGLSDIGPEGEDAPERDPFFPYRFIARAQHDSIERIALRDAANAASSAWAKRSASYAAILTLLAVALYLFGFALTPQGRGVRGLFAVAGIVFLTVCVIFGPVRALSSPTLAPEAAATAYADAEIATQTAAGPADYEAAVADYTRAIELRPDFADAYIGRQNASFFAGSTQRFGGGSLTSAEALKSGVEDYRMAIQLGARTPDTLGGLGFHLLELGLLEGDDQLLEQALEETESAIEGAPEEPTWRFNLGVILLAKGDVDEAKTAYEEALTVADEARDRSYYPDVIAGGLTDLELVALLGNPELLDETQQMRDLIATAGGKRSDVDQLEASEGYAVAQPGRISLVLEENEGLERGDRLNQQWYHLDPGAFSWANLAGVSGRWELFAGGGSLFNRIYVAPAVNCAPSGTYRTDVYDSDGLAAQFQTKLGRHYEFFQDHDTGVLGCLPEGWRHDAEGGTPVRSYSSPDGKGGLLLVRLDSIEPQPPTNTLPEVRAAMDSAFAMVGERFFDGPVSFKRSDAQQFMGTTTYRIHYAYPQGQILASITTQSDGSLVAALAYGSDGFFKVRPGQFSTPDLLMQSLYERVPAIAAAAG